MVRPPRKTVRLPWPREKLEHERAIALGFAIEPASKLAYSSAVQSYLDFCKSHDFPITPTPDTLSYYVVYMCHHIKPSSVKSYLSGICNQLESFFPEVRTARHHHLVIKTLTGCTKLLSSPTSRKDVISREDLNTLSLAFGNSDSHNDRLFLAICVSSFHGLLRMGENVWPDKAALRDYRKVIRRASVHISPNSFSFILPTHKADRLYEGNRVLIHRANAGDDSMKAFSNYISSRDQRFPLNPELWLLEDGSIPTHSWFALRLHSFFPNRNISGHSFRPGGATALAIAGVPPHLIQALGRWSSEAFQIYIRKHPALLAALVYSESHHPSPPP